MTLYTEEVDRLFKLLGVKLSTRYRTSPIDMLRITSAYCIKVIQKEFDDDVSGILVKSCKGTYIFLNSLHHVNRQRFSLGHEFGHYCLGHPNDVSTVLPEDISHRYEVEANKFSTCILMPIQLMHGLAKQGKTIPEIAKWLRVSKIAAAFRCRDFGYRVEEAEDIISQYWLEQGDARSDEWHIEQVTIAASDR